MYYGNPGAMVEKNPTLFYFKPESVPTGISLRNVKATIPIRHGFTAVEWGGTIDNQKIN